MSQGPITPSADPERPAQAGRILIVDDNEANRESLTRRLQRHGYAVESAASGEAALLKLASGREDLILLDVMMPGINGLEVLRRIRQDHPPERLPVIMATAMDRSQDIVAALELGANDYVTKPLDFPVVLARVRAQFALKNAVERSLALEAQLILQNAELQRANSELHSAAERTRRDLESAARVQETFLPASLPAVPAFNFAWHYKPCEALAGDALNILMLGPDHIGFYVLDVSGHGVAASLLAVMATRLLSETEGKESVVMVRENGTSRPARPAEVAGQLARRFAWKDATEQFFTLFYAVLNIHTREISYVSAGHPGAIWLSRERAPRVLAGSGLPIGVGESYEQDAVRLEHGDRFYLYSDGVMEVMNGAREQFGIARIAASVAAASTGELRKSIDALLCDVEAWGGGPPVHDDISVVGMEAL